jgi:tetratricopeptide (TPR) repeat protein
MTCLGCLSDEAERMYLSALQGEESGMTRSEQIALVTRAIALAPDREHYYEVRAIYQIDLRDFPEALTDVDRAIGLGDRPYLRFLRGLVLCQSRRCDSGVPELDRAITSEPANTQFYRARGLALAEVHRFDEALADGDHLVGEVPQMAESYYVRGVALQGLGRHSDAVQDFSTAIRIRSELIYPLHARARSFAALGDTARAGADEAAAVAARTERSGCELCTDPFRY